MERFSDRSEPYARYRPSYPPEVFDVLFEGMDRAQVVVADIGAGTGISSRQLAHIARHVIAIEPNAAMRARADSMENVEWRDGAAEHAGLSDKSVDLAVAFQAFHWFAADRAFAEFCRIARVRTGMVQYERDERDAFSAGYGAIVRRYATDDTEALRAQTLVRFAELGGERTRRRDIPFGQTLDLEGVLGRVDSSSYLPKSGVAAEALRADVRELFGRLQHRGCVTMAMFAHVLTIDV